MNSNVADIIVQEGAIFLNDVSKHSSYYKNYVCTVDYENDYSTVDIKSARDYFYDLILAYFKYYNIINYSIIVEQNCISLKYDKSVRKGC